VCVKKPEFKRVWGSSMLMGKILKSPQQQRPSRSDCHAPHATYMVGLHTNLGTFSKERARNGVRGEFSVGNVSKKRVENGVRLCRAKNKAGKLGNVSGRWKG